MNKEPVEKVDNAHLVVLAVDRIMQSGAVTIFSLSVSLCLLFATIAGIVLSKDIVSSVKKYVEQLPIKQEVTK